jgi:hypothetical protein
MKSRFLLVAAISLLLLTHAPAAPKTTATPTNSAPAKPAPKAQPVPIAAPAFVDSVTFNIESSGDRHLLTVISAPGLVRIDAPDDRLSVIYDPATEHYIGLEHSNYTYWEFSWPEVRDAVQNTHRYAQRLQDLGPELMEENAIQPPGTSTDSTTPSALANADGTTNSATVLDPNAAAATTSAGDDTTGYVWHTTIDKKRIGDYDCVHWVGETVAGEKIDAWCAPSLLPQVEKGLTILQTVNEPIALVPVRDFVPPLVFVAWRALTKGGVTPVLMTWGSDSEADRFTLVNVKQRDGKLSYFQVPKDYIKTTLVTMDGVGNQKPVTGRRDAPTPAEQNPLLKNPVLNNN